MSRMRIVGAIVLACACLVFLCAADAHAAQRSRITASAMDSNGNVYVTGWRTLGTGTSAYPVDAVTIKYDRVGNVLWTHSYPADPSVTDDTEPWGIAVDPEGNVYVAGHSGTQTNVDCMLIKFPEGYQQGQDPEWVRTWDGGYGHDQNWSIAVDSDGYIYTTGYSVQEYDGVRASDIVTLKYAGDGTLQWSRLYNGPASSGEMGFAIAVDPVTKNVYVAGRSKNTATSFDMVTLMYDSDGTQQWARPYGGPVNGFNTGASLALDGVGNVYVTGWSTGDGTSVDIATIKYDLAGSEVWVARYDGPAGAADSPAPPVGGALSGSGANTNYIQNNQGIIVTTEMIEPAPAVTYLIAKVSALDLPPDVRAGLLDKLNACLASLLAPNADVRANAGNVLAAFINQFRTPSVTRRITAGEVEELKAVASQIHKAIRGVGTEVVYVGGQSTGVGTNVDFVLLKYNAEDGHPMWNLPGQPGTAAGKPGSPANIALRYDGPVGYIDRGWAMAMDRDGNVFLTGPGSEQSGVGVDYVTLKFFVNTYEPVLAAKGRYNGPGNGTDQSCGIAAWRDPVTGRYFIFRDPATGADYVAVTGNSQGTTRSEFATVMYDGALVEQWVRRFYQ